MPLQLDPNTKQPVNPMDIFGDTLGSKAWEGGPDVQASMPADATAKAEPEYLNAYDPDWTLDKWRSLPMSMHVPLPDEPVTCEDICKEEHKKADEKCSIARKRVELGLKKAGCPSKVLAVKRKTACGGRKAAPKPKPKAKAKASTRKR
jgi:hypothetical protein